MLAESSLDTKMAFFAESAVVVLPPGDGSTIRSMPDRVSGERDSSG
jgi:hypothetical protein